MRKTSHGRNRLAKAKLDSTFVFCHQLQYSIDDFHPWTMSEINFEPDRSSAKRQNGSIPNAFWKVHTKINAVAIYSRFVDHNKMYHFVFFSAYYNVIWMWIVCAGIKVGIFVVMVVCFFVEILLGGKISPWTFFVYTNVLRKFLWPS